MDHTSRRPASPVRWRPTAIHEEPQERAISLLDALIGCVQITLGISAHDPSIGRRAASRELPSCRGSPQGESKDFNMHDRAVMVNAFAIKEAGARARAAMGSA
jgi:hypothetical protein